MSGERVDAMFGQLDIPVNLRLSWRAVFGHKDRAEQALTFGHSASVARATRLLP
jgi:hypothetical protein